MNVLQKYTERVNELHAFEKAHVRIFKELNFLRDEIRTLETKLKEEARTTGGVENESIRVVVTRAWRKWYDAAKLWKLATADDRLTLLDSGAITQEVDKKVFEQLLKDERVDRRLAVETFYEEEMTPRISIVEKELEKDSAQSEVKEKVTA